MQEKQSADEVEFTIFNLQASIFFCNPATRPGFKKGCGPPGYDGQSVRFCSRKGSGYLVLILRCISMRRGSVAGPLVRCATQI